MTETPSNKSKSINQNEDGPDTPTNILCTGLVSLLGPT